MPFNLSYINQKITSDAQGFTQECEASYREMVEHAARSVADNMARCPIVLLSGPSGSGKTTTAQKISRALGSLGIKARSIALDHYYLTRYDADLPTTPEGDIDFESPMCIDWQLLNTHFDELAQGSEVVVPHFSFAAQARKPEKAKPLRLGSDEVVIFEGIHALNSLIADTHPDAFRLYISANTDTYLDDKLVFKGIWTRLMRRSIRDELFRGAAAIATVSMWENVLRGEKNYITPFMDTADLKLDTALPYEVAALRALAAGIFMKTPNGAERYNELPQLLEALQLYADFDSTLIPPDSVLREFIGGGIYEY